MDGNTGGVTSLYAGVVGAGAGILGGELGEALARSQGGSDKAIAYAKEAGGAVGTAPGNAGASNTMLHITADYTVKDGQMHIVSSSYTYDKTGRTHDSVSKHEKSDSDDHNGSDHDGSGHDHDHNS